MVTKDSQTDIQALDALLLSPLFSTISLCLGDICLREIIYSISHLVIDSPLGVAYQMMVVCSF